MSDLLPEEEEIQTLNHPPEEKPWTFSKGDDSERVKERETDLHRLAQRQKQIDYGKNTIGYEQYSKLVPKQKRFHSYRLTTHPVTPDKHAKCSKKQFDGLVRTWRRLLHRYDNSEEYDVDDDDNESGIGTPVVNTNGQKIGGNKDSRNDLTASAVSSSSSSDETGKDEDQQNLDDDASKENVFSATKSGLPLNNCMDDGDNESLENHHQNFKQNGNQNRLLLSPKKKIRRKQPFQSPDRNVHSNNPSFHSLSSDRPPNILGGFSPSGDYNLRGRESRGRYFSRGTERRGRGGQRGKGRGLRGRGRGASSHQFSGRYPYNQQWRKSSSSSFSENGRRFKFRGGRTSDRHTFGDHLQKFYSSKQTKNPREAEMETSEKESERQGLHGEQDVVMGDSPPK